MDVKDSDVMTARDAALADGISQYVVDSMSDGMKEMLVVRTGYTPSSAWSSGLVVRMWQCVGGKPGKRFRLRNNVALNVVATLPYRHTGLQMEWSITG